MLKTNCIVTFKLLMQYLLVIANHSEIYTHKIDKIINYNDYLTKNKLVIKYVGHLNNENYALGNY